MQKILAMLLVVVLLVAALPLSAQEGLSEEEIALLQKVVDGYNAILAYQSYIRDETVNSTNTTILKIGDQTQQRDTLENTTTHIVITRGATPNGQKTMTQIIEDTIDGTYTLLGELRYVDGVLYASGQYLSGTGPQPFPLGFSIVTLDVEGAETGYETFEPQDFVNAVLGVPDEDSLVNYIASGDLETIAGILGSITQAEGDWNGVPATVITLEFGPEQIPNILAFTADVDPGMEMLFAAVSENSQGTVKFYFDTDGNPLAQISDITFEIVDFDLGQVDPQAAGVLASLNSTISETAAFSQVNQPLEQVTAPQNLAQ
jgi:hypothetical protein